MIKIEKIDAVNATVVRNGIVQSLLTGSQLLPEELATVTADAGAVVYSVDEREIKTLVFQKAAISDTIASTDTVTPVITKPAIKQPAPRAAKVTKPD